MAGDKKKRKLLNEIIPLSIGGGVAGLSMLPWLLAPQPVERKIRHIGARQLYAKARPGDIVLQHSKVPVSGWRALGRLITDSPYYHADIVGPRKRTYMAGESDTLRNTLKENVALLIRPKLTARQRAQLLPKLRKLEATPYSAKKVGLLFLLRSLVPARVRYPRVGGEVCSTGPASVLRGVGCKLNMPVTPGYELTGDYIRSPSFKVIGASGKRYDPVSWTRYHALPRRLGTALALGGGAYLVGREIVPEPLTAASTLAGGGLGLALGKILDQTAMESDPVEAFKQQLRGGRFLAGGPRREKALEALFKRIRKLPLVAPPAAMLLGAGIPYMVSKLIYRRARRRREEEQRERRRAARERST